MLPFIKIPFLEAKPIPAKYPSGIDTTKAQGHETTKNIKALEIHGEKLSPLITKGGIIARANAENTTTGV